MTIRMVNVPASYELARTAVAVNFINQAEAWLIEQHADAVRVADAASEAAATAKRAALKAERIAEAFASAETLAAETVAAVAVAAETLQEEAKAAADAAAFAAAEAAQLKRAVETATTLPAINTWAEIK